MSDELLTVTWEIVDDGNLNHGVATWLLLHGGTCNIDEHLSSEGRVVNLHIELEELVVGLATDALASEVDTVTYVIEGIDALYLEDMGLIVGEVWVCLDSLGDLSEVSTGLEFYIDHATVYAFAYRDGHREGILDTCLGTYADRVTHRATRTEVGVGESLRSE